MRLRFSGTPGALPTAAVVEGQVLDVAGEGRDMLNGETLVLAFGEEKGCRGGRTAGRLAAYP
jgi:hypothetical protein